MAYLQSPVVRHDYHICRLHGTVHATCEPIFERILLRRDPDTALPATRGLSQIGRDLHYDDRPGLESQSRATPSRPLLLFGNGTVYHIAIVLDLCHVVCCYLVARLPPKSIMGTNHEPNKTVSFHVHDLVQC